MKLVKITSAVVGVGSSRKGNTTTKGRLEYPSLCVFRLMSSPKIFQVYITVPPYQYCIPPMSKDRSLGAVWYSCKTTKLS